MRRGEAATVARWADSAGLYLVGLLGLAAVAALWAAPPAYAVVGIGVVAAAGITLRQPLFGLGLIAFSVPWASGLQLPVSGFPFTPTEALVGALGFAWIVASIHERRSPIATSMWTPYIVMFLVAISLSATQASDIHAALREVFKWTEMGVVFLAGAMFVRGRDDVRFVVAAAVAAGVTQAAMGYVQFLGHIGPEAFATHGSFIRAYGSFDQPNPYAGYLNIVLPFATSFALLSPNRRERVLYASAGLVILGALVLSESRGALLAWMVATAIVLACMSARVRLLVWTGVLGVLSGSLLVNFGLVPVGPFAKVLDTIGLGGVSFEHVTDANFSAVERAAHWLAGVRMFESHPLLGVGIGNYAAAYPAYHPRGWYPPLGHAHNYYINIAAEAGVVGLAAYALLLGSALCYSYAAMSRARNPVFRAAALGVLGALSATSFHNLFDVLYVHGIPVLIGLLLALVASGIRDGERRQDGALARE